MIPPAQVLDLFAVPGRVEQIPGGRGRSVRAGDLVLSPGRDAVLSAWLSPQMARLAVGLDTHPSRQRRDLRVAMPVPARDGSWVVQGWAASRYEPGTVACQDLDVTLAAGRVLHARLAVAVRTLPEAVAARDDRWARAERLGFGPGADAVAAAAGTPAEEPVRRLVDALTDADPASLGVDQLVHADLAGNVLLDGAGAPVVLDVVPSWRPVRWAEALATFDAVAWRGTPLEVLETWSTAVDRQALRRAALARLLVLVVEDEPGWAEIAAYAPVLGALEELGVVPER